MEHYLSLQVDAVADAGREHVDRSVAALKADHAALTAQLIALVTRLERKVKDLRAGVSEAGLVAASPPAGSGLSASSSGGQRTREGSSAPPQTPDRGTAAGTPARQSPPSSAPSNPTAGVPASLARNRANVPQLRLQQKLRGVEVLDAKGQCVPLLKGQVGLSWGRALEEYATGLDGRVAVREVEALCGARWRLLVADPDERSRHVHIYSTRAPLYRVLPLSLVVGAPPWEKL